MAPHARDSSHGPRVSHGHGKARPYVRVLDSSMPCYTFLVGEHLSKAPDIMPNGWISFSGLFIMESAPRMRHSLTQKHPESDEGKGGGMKAVQIDVRTESHRPPPVLNCRLGNPDLPEPPLFQCLPSPPDWEITKETTNGV